MLRRDEATAVEVLDGAVLVCFVAVIDAVETADADAAFQSSCHFGVFWSKRFHGQNYF